MPTVKFADGKFSNKDAVERLVTYIFKSERPHYDISGALGVYPINPEDIIDQFNMIQEWHRNTKGRKVYHLIVSFSDDEMTQLDKCDYEEIGYSIADLFWDAGHQTAFALHENKDHLHFHLAINAVDHISGKKYRLKRGSYRQIDSYVKSIVNDFLSDEM